MNIILYVPIATLLLLFVARATFTTRQRQRTWYPLIMWASCIAYLFAFAMQVEYIMLLPFAVAANIFILFPQTFIRQFHK
jgi:hypothetical protein